MRGWLKGALLASLVFCGSWIGAVSYWRATNRMPSTLDLFAWMAALPLALLLAVWLGRRIAAARAAAASPAPTGDAAAAAPAAPPALPALAILAGAVHTPHGASAQELSQAVGEGRARADLDPELVDQDGFPLMSARVQLDAIELFKEELDAWRSSAGHADPRFTDEQWRALALGTAVAGELLMQATGHPQLRAGAEDGAGAAPLPVLRIQAVLASSWNEEQRAIAAAWLGALSVRAGWPEKRLEVTSLATQASAVLAQLADHAARPGETVFTIVLGFGSQIGETAVEELAMQGALFAAANPQGLIPGEAAAGLLVADAAQAAQCGLPTTVLQLASMPRNAKDAGRKPDALELRQLAATLLSDAQDSAGVSAVLADTSHRSAGVLELMKFSGEVLPHLDAGQDIRSLGGACGHCGHGEQLPFLAALVLAHQHALDTAGAALCVGNEDPLQRTAALVRPAAALS